MCGSNVKILPYYIQFKIIEYCWNDKYLSFKWKLSLKSICHKYLDFIFKSLLNSFNHNIFEPTKTTASSESSTNHSNLLSLLSKVNILNLNCNGRLITNLSLFKQFLSNQRLNDSSIKLEPIFKNLHTLDISFNHPRVNLEFIDSLFNLLLDEEAKYSISILKLHAFNSFPFERLDKLDSVTSLNLNLSTFGYGSSKDQDFHKLSEYFERNCQRIKRLSVGYRTVFKPTLSLLAPDTAFSRMLLANKILTDQCSALTHLEFNSISIAQPDDFFFNLMSLQSLVTLRFKNLFHTNSTRFNHAFCLFFKSNSTLRCLELFFPVGEHITTLFPNKVNLYKLSLNPLFIVKFNQSLKKLSLNDIDYNTLDEFAKMNRGIQLIKLKVFLISTNLPVFASMSQLLRTTESLTHLKWIGCNSLVFKPLITSLRLNSSIQSLSLNFADDLLLNDDEDGSLDDQCFRDLEDQVNKTLTLVLSSLDNFNNNFNSIKYISNSFQPKITSSTSLLTEKFKLSEKTINSCSFIRVIK